MELKIRNFPTLPQKRTLLSLEFLVLLLVVLLNGALCAKNVTISKCCKLQETLSGADKCVSVLNSGNVTWELSVFSPAKHTYLQKNTVPPNWRLKEASRPARCSKPTLFTAHLGNYIPFQNGSLFIPGYTPLFHPTEYCIDHKSMLVCLPESGGGDTPQSISYVRVKKCCGSDAIFSDTNLTCISIKDPSYHIDLKSDKMTLGAGFPYCEHHKYNLVGKLHEATMHEGNGSLWLNQSNTMLPVGNYCLEHVLENTGRSASIIICQDDLPPSVTIRSTTKAAASDLRFTIYPIGLALSAIFLAATLAAGSILPATHHILHWRCQTNHVACLLGGDVLLCITHLSGRMQPSLCFWMAVAMHFLFLAAFFWLNTMCFNIWWTFRDLRPQSVEKNQEKWRLRWYALYAWGVPLIIAGTAAILDNVPGSDLLRPNFGRSNCWFHGDIEILTFFFGPVGILLLINVALFAMTARELTCGLWKRELVKSTTERAALGRVCMKLVVVMGVTWIADVISWAVGGPQELWYLTDLINCLQGVFIFIVVGCQPQVFAAVKRLWCLRKHRREMGAAGTTTNHHSSISQGLPSMADTTLNSSVPTTNKTSVPLETSC